MPRSLSALGSVLVMLLVPSAQAAAGDLGVYVDERGRTVITDDPARAPDGARRAAPHERTRLRTLWEGELTGAPLAAGDGSSSKEPDRIRRALRSVGEDLRRGERARAESALRGLLRREPGLPEAHYLLAHLEGRRGHVDAAEDHLRRFLAAAGPELAAWRRAAARRLEQLEDERALLETPEARPLRMVDLAHPAFRIRADAALVEAGGAGFARTVAGFLDDARSSLGRWLGTEPSAPLGVLLYGRDAYQRTHGPRFSFRTVGFFDGRIHVVSAAHPDAELRALLFHEYAHALFRERTGGDRPYWLNEGLAELAERRSAGRAPLSGGERRALARAAAGDAWIPLARLAAGFDGLGDGRARLAYRIATAAAHWIDARTDAAARRELLRRLGAGAAVDAALAAVLGRDTAALDAALRAELTGRAAPLPAAGQEGGTSPREPAAGEG